MNFAKFALFTLSALLPLSVATTSAHADTFDWTLTGPSASLGGFAFTGDGTIDANFTAGKWVISGITGTIGGENITVLSSFESATNLLFPTSTFIDTAGLSFDTANGTLFNIFSFITPGSTIAPGTNNYGEIDSVNGFDGVGTFTLTAVPEPATFALLGTGLFGLSGIVRRRFSR